MLRVFGDMPVGVDIHWPSKSVTIHRTDLAQSPEISRFTVDECADMVGRLEQGERWLECGFRVPVLPGQVAIGAPAVLVDLELDAGHIIWTVAGMVSAPVVLRVSALQSEGLRRAMTRAKTVIATGVGDMVTP